MIGAFSNQRLSILFCAALTTLVSLNASAQMACGRAEGEANHSFMFDGSELFITVSGDCVNGCGHFVESFYDNATAYGAWAFSGIPCRPLLIAEGHYNLLAREFYSEAENRAYNVSTHVCDSMGRVKASHACPCETCFFPTPGEDPLVISVADPQFRFSNFATGVAFDLNADGKLDRTAWTQASSDDAFLVLDRNFNGQIDNGHEIFGDETPQLPSDMPNGFRALAVFDDPQSGGNGDGTIDSQDRIYRDLMLWTDTNHDGTSAAPELRLLSEEVESIQLAYEQDSTFDEHGNELRYRASIVRTTGSEGSAIAWNVFFANQPTTREQEISRELENKVP
ncbi:MAG TPA: hypothetical protein VGQ76_10555 [Thermoanaerobaculia bacterium]|jgi:hypothetical protein|nr:hypothetical protein [Thermoanaerobaculia bacterium]